MYAAFLHITSAFSSSLTAERTVGRSAWDSHQSHTAPQHQSSQQPHMEHTKTPGLQETNRLPSPLLQNFIRSTNQPHFFDLEIRSEWEQCKLCAGEGSRSLCIYIMFHLRFPQSKLPFVCMRIQTHTHTHTHKHTYIYRSVLFVLWLFWEHTSIGSCETSLYDNNVTLINKDMQSDVIFWYLRWKIISTSLNCQAGSSLFVGCPWT